MLVGITGGTGFVGMALLLRHIDHGDKVRVLSRNLSASRILPDAVKFFCADLTGPEESLKPFVDGVDILYHCAGEIKDRMKMFSVNVSGTRNLCAAADRKIRHWVQLSSVGAYGPHSDGIITEETPLKPMGIYEITKVISDQLVSDAAGQGAFTFSILRPSNIFGPAMRNKSLFKMIEMINKGFFFFIGKPGASANYIYIDNVINGLILCGKAQKAVGQIYNISDHRTIEDFVAGIASGLNKKAPRVRLPEKPVRLIARRCNHLPGFPLTEKRVDALTGRSRYSIKKIQDELEYVHKVSMEEGLLRMVTRENR